MRKKIIEMIVGLERRAAERAVRRKGRKEGWSVSKIMAEEVAEADLAERISRQATEKSNDEMICKILAKHHTWLNSYADQCDI